MRWIVRSVEKLYVPKNPSYRILDVAEAIGPECEKPIVGIRPVKSFTKKMITSSDSPYTIENEKNFVIVPSLYDFGRDETMARYTEHHRGTITPTDFRYSSGKKYRLAFSGPDSKPYSKARRP